MARNVISSTVLILVAFLVGFRPTASLTEWLMIAGIVLLFSFAISCLGAIVGLLARSVEAVNWIGFMAVFPLTFASSAFVPAGTMPYALRLFAEHQPVTHVIETLRALMVGTPMGTHALWAVGWCIAIIALSLPLVSYLFARHVSR
jgi:ABC-2 type transport system permease protein